MDFAAKFSTGLTYQDFLAKYGSDEHRRRWAATHEQIHLTDAQRALLAGFTREIKVLVMAGAWCGDCVDQCPILDCFQAAARTIETRYFDRDANPDLQQAVAICGAARVPLVVFLSEEGNEVARFGDRTLAKYRHVAASQLGDACPTGLAPQSRPLMDATVEEWLQQYERVHLMLRTSPRLRQKHGD